VKRERTIETFDIEIPRIFAYRLLGMKKSGRPPRESVIELFEDEYARAHELVDAKAVMRMSHAGLPGSTHIDAVMPVVVVVCTIGPALEARVAELTDRDETARAIILDSIGSAAAEEVADRSNQIICSMATPTDFAPDTRRSPGYGTWNIREQTAIFEYLEPDDIGVTLTDTCMMIPRKSVSYAVPLEGGKAGEGKGHRCENCNMKHCPYRADGQDALFDWMNDKGDPEQ